MNGLPDRPVCILIAALGGEGGGVLADWLVDAATAEGFPVQSTSIPGVSQRTGATTYYVEIYPAKREVLGGREPVLALTPSPGNVDLLAASELIEAGRAMQNGYVSPERTTLIASTHRVYATAEKMAMGDGRYDEAAVIEAGKRLAARPLLFEMNRLAHKAGTIINTVLFGAIAGCGVLPLSREACEAAIRRSGKAVEVSLAGFAAGHARARQEAADEPAPAAPATPVPAAGERVRRDFDASLHGVLALGVARLADYQDEAYADLFLDRIARIRDAAGAGEAGIALTREAARQLAVWMSYEDVARVAQLKSRPERYRRVRHEVHAKPGQPVAVTEFLKPGVDEVCDALPPGLAALVRSRGSGLFGQPVHLRSTTVSGWLALRILARLRGWRRRSTRYAHEQALIEDWLAALTRLGKDDPPAALETAQLPSVLKGYGDTRRRGRASFERIFAELVESAPAPGLAERVRAAREAALADPEGRGLGAALGVAAGPEAGAAATAAPVRFMPRPTK